MAVNLWELAVGLLPSSVVAIVPVLFGVNVALIVMFALAQRRA